MLIQCPACKANAEVPTTKEGAKVKCGECGRIYVAAPLGARKARVASGGNNGLYIGLGVAGVVLLIFIAISRKGSGDDDLVPVVVAEEDSSSGGMIDTTGWDSEILKAVRRIHKASAERDQGILLNLLEPGHYYAWRTWRESEDEGDLDVLAGVAAYNALPADEQLAAQQQAIEELTTGEAVELVADWAPYDGSVAHLTDDYAVVHVSVTPAAGGTEKRTVEWELVKDSNRWKAFRWERWFSDAEKRHNRKKRASGYEKVTLSDGSLVFEREPEPLGHLDDTPEAVRKQIDAAFGVLFGEDMRASNAARRELEAIGKPAVPILLTALFEIPLDTEENAIRVNIVVLTLRSITGQNFGYKPLVLQGSGVGTTDERRTSSIKQWFAWWYRKGSKFEEKVTTDALEELIQLSDKDKAWLERNKD